MNKNLIFTLFFAVSGILFYKCGYPKIEEIIKGILRLKQEYTKNDGSQVIIPKINKNHKKGKKKKIKKKKSKLIINNNNIGITTHKNMNKSKSSKSILFKPDITIYKTIEIIDKEKNIKKNNLSENIKISDSLDFKEYELNSLLYVDALKYDKRSFYECYISLIKRKHPLIFPFTKDYNSTIIKIDLIVLSFSIQYFFNALFFNESAIHEIYEGKGNYNIIDLAPFIFYSLIFSLIINIIIKYLSLSENNIITIKKQESLEDVFDALSKENKTLKIKYICFYGFSFILFFFLWYYLSSFGAVYQNTQICLIKNVLISFAFSLLYPFVINFITSILRIYSLNNSNRELLYKLSIIIYHI